MWQGLQTLTNNRKRPPPIAIAYPYPLARRLPVPFLLAVVAQVLRVTTGEYPSPTPYSLDHTYLFITYLVGIQLDTHHC